MKKLLITLGLVASFSAMAGDGIGGHCGTGVSVGETVTQGGESYKVQWVTKNGPNCKAGKDQIKLVYLDEFLPPQIFQEITENASVVKAMLFAHVGLEILKQNQVEKILQKNCLIEDNYRGLSCVVR